MNPLASARTRDELEAALAVGQSFPSKEAFQDWAIALFLKRGEPALAKKKRSDKTRVAVGCGREKCSFLVSAAPDKSGAWVVRASTLEHSCDGTEPGARKRQLSSDTLQRLVPEVASLAVVRGKAATAVQELVQSSAGVHVKRTQAAVIAKGNRDDPVGRAQRVPIL